MDKKPRKVKDLRGFLFFSSQFNYQVYECLMPHPRGQRASVGRHRGLPCRHPVGMALRCFGGADVRQNFRAAPRLLGWHDLSQFCDILRLDMSNSIDF